jgi:hypothetical protein
MVWLSIWDFHKKKANEGHNFLNWFNAISSTFFIRLEKYFIKKGVHKNLVNHNKFLKWGALEATLIMNIY